MYKSVMWWFFLLILLTGCGSPAYQLVNEGNTAFEQQEYEAALDAYHEAKQLEPELLEPTYNAANTYYHQDGHDVASHMLQEVVEQAEGVLAQYGLYNLGNVFFNQEQYELAIEAYKAALRLKPDDFDAKHNLELALLRRDGEQNEEEQEEEQEEGQEEEQEQQEEQDQQEQQEQEQQEQEQQEQEQEEQEQEEQEQDQQDSQQNQEGGEQNEQDESEQPSSGSSQPNESQKEEEQAPSQPIQVIPLTPEQAEQLLESIQNGSQTLQEKLQEIYIAPGGAPAEDW